MIFFFEVMLIGLVLSADSFSAAVAMGFRPFTRKDAFRFAFSSGFAEAIVALIGAMAGKHLINQLNSIDHWIAFGLLFVVAIHMGHEGIVEFIAHKKESERNASEATSVTLENKRETTNGFHSLTKIIIVSLATSLDALGVGVGLGVSKQSIFPFILSIGLWAFVATIAGLYLARRISDRFGPVVNIISSIILIILSFQMLKI